jgi:mannose-1-phosphate guanylyltransferase
MQAVILAGGLGTRLRPITKTTPKCLAPVGDRPFLFYLLLMLKTRKIDNIVLCVGHLGNKIETLFGDGKKTIGVPISYSREKDCLLGTGGALKLAAKLIEDKFFVLNGDTYLNIDYADIFRQFSDCGRQAVVVVCPCRRGEHSNLSIDVNSLVTRYDKGFNGRLGYVNAGVLVFKKDVLSEISPGRPVSLESEVFPKLIEKRQMMACITPQRFYDIGTFTGLGVFSCEVEKKEQR